jgi:hypothetical protein
MESLADYEIAEPLIDPKLKAEEDWFAKRSGKFTCSRFGDLMVSGRGKDEVFGATAWGYILQVAAERVGSYTFPFDTSPVRWGKENERQALIEYCDRVGLDVEDVRTGVEAYTERSEFIGGTPDGICLPGVIEIKCPYTPQEHMRTAHHRDVPKQYYWQVQGHMLLTGADYCDFVSFDPRIADEHFRMVIVRVQRQKPIMDELAARLDLAVETMLNVLK